jgi:hypothetical protein
VELIKSGVTWIGHQFLKNGEEQSVFWKSLENMRRDVEIGFQFGRILIKRPVEYETESVRLHLKQQAKRGWVDVGDGSSFPVDNPEAAQVGHMGKFMDPDRFMKQGRGFGSVNDRKPVRRPARLRPAQQDVGGDLPAV